MVFSSTNSWSATAIPLGRGIADKRDFGWIKVDGYVIQPFSMGLFLARVLRGSHITMEQTRVDEGLWMPQHIEVRTPAGAGRSGDPMTWGDDRWSKRGISLGCRFVIT